MNYYYIYNELFAPQVLKDRHPHAQRLSDSSIPNSNSMILFVTSLEDETGVAAESISLINKSEEDLSNDDLNTAITGLLKATPSPTEYWLRKDRGTYLYNTRFKKQEVLN